MLFTIIIVLAIPSAIAQDNSVLSNIHKRLMIPGYEARHGHDRIVLVGGIAR
ncbi:MAG: hypothetical protein WA020_15795 [Candidatus Acidiferrales bacterium]